MPPSSSILDEFPRLFPKSLKNTCNETLTSYFLKLASRLSNYDNPDFQVIVGSIKDYLTSFLCGGLLDSLFKTKMLQSHSLSTISFFLSLRMNHRILTLDLTDLSYTELLMSKMGMVILLSNLKQCNSLQKLILKNTGDDDVLEALSSCSKLTYLDLSGSIFITDYKLLSLTSLKYLTELHLRNESLNLSPNIIALLLKQIKLKVFNIQNLHEGILFYIQTYGMTPLNLTYYIGIDTQLIDVINIIPNVICLELSVTSFLPKLGQDLATRPNIIRKLILTPAAEPEVFEASFKEFLTVFGSSISHIELIKTPIIDVTLLSTLSPNLEFLTLKNTLLSYTLNNTNLKGVLLPKFPFLYSVQILNADPDDAKLKIFIKDLLLCATDLEFFTCIFSSRAYYFSDLFLDEILKINSLSFITEIDLQNVGSTLISALKLLTSRPKLNSLGSIQTWDVENSELETFLSILRRAVSVGAFKDINIF